MMSHLTIGNRLGQRVVEESTQCNGLALELEAVVGFCVNCTHLLILLLIKQ